MPCRAQTLQQEMRSVHALFRSTRTFIYLQYRVLLENKFSKLNELFCNYKYRIGGVMVSMFDSSAVDRAPFGSY